MKAATIDICINCKRQIGSSEKAYVVDGGLICPECDRKLSGSTADTAGLQTPEDTKQVEKKKRRVPLLFTLLRLLAWLALPIYSMYIFVMWGFGQIPQLQMSQALLMAAVGLAIFIFITPLRTSLIRLSTGQLSGKKKFDSIGKWLFSLLVFFLVSAFVHDINRDDYRNKLFKHFIARPIPPGVKILDGTSFKWQDSWFCNLLFETNERSFRAIAKDYEPFTMDKHTYNSLSWKHYNTLYNPACYHKKVKLSDKFYDSCYLFWDKTNGLAYFHVHDGRYRQQ